jgi:hypothetical protein
MPEAPVAIADRRTFRLCMIHFLLVGAVNLVVFEMAQQLLPR